MRMKTINLLKVYVVVHKRDVLGVFATGEDAKTARDECSEEGVKIYKKIIK